MKYLIHLTVLLLASSCAQQKLFLKNNQINYLKVDAHPGPDPGERGVDSLVILKLKKCIRATIKERENYLEIIPDSMRHDDTTILFTRPIIITDDQKKQIDFIALKGKLLGKYFVPEVLTDEVVRKKINYLDLKPVFQTLTIPLKIRPAIKDAKYKDSFPSQAETGVNVGIALGWKLNLNYYKTNGNIVKQKGYSLSLSAGGFYGLGATSLTKGNTREPTITIERKVVSHHMGGFAMLGFNNINLGYALGWDFATGPQKKSWMYQKRLWHGVVLALDLIK